MLSYVEKSALLDFFNRGGYVLNFSTSDFDIFTLHSIGVPLCEKYKMSKGKSLVAYCSEASENEVVKLFVDLMDYYELNCTELYGEEKYIKKFQRCKTILDREHSAEIKIEAPEILNIDRSYIKSVAERAFQDIDNGNFDSALTKSRTLLEEVFCHAIESKKEKPSEKGDIAKLYAQVKDLYNMHGDKDINTRINKLLSGLEKIVSSIGEMRNKFSDAHEVGSSRKNISDYHARLFVNSALTMAEFILSVERANLLK